MGLTPSGPLQNRVGPTGEIVACSARGALMGNRGGRLHDPKTKRLTRRRWASKRWISCVLDFKGRHREVMGPGYTELFFLDEATALAAGHRPCFECRRADAIAFAAAWALARGREGPAKADEIDAILHKERLTPIDARPTARLADLPAGAMALVDGAPGRVADGAFQRWRFDGYGATRPLSDVEGTVLTPPSILDALRAGYRVRPAAR